MQIVETNTVVVGASAAGLATAASLKRAGVPFELLEQSDRVGSAWHGHYERLHLHTSRGFSGLPYRPMPSSYPRYPSRAQVIEYLERYAAELELVPRFGEHVETLRRVDGFWTASSKQREYRSRNVVVATGYTRKPKIPSFLD